MSKKRSIGVSIFGWWYIIVGILGILNLPIMFVMRQMSAAFPHMRNVFMEQFMGGFYILYLVVVTIASLITGIGLLKLKPWARKMVIALCVVGMAYSIFFSTQMLMHSSQFVENSLPSQTLSKGTPTEAIEAMKLFTQGILIVSVIVGVVFGMGFVIFTIWFFKRKSVVEQFQPNVGTATMEQSK
jgi:hypothetical protein